MFLNHKDEATAKMKQHLMYLERRWENKPRKIRVDNGKEYINNELLTWCKDKEIEIQTTAPYTPEQNGVTERFNRTLTELACAMMIARDLPEFLWAEAVAHAAYLRNRVPTRVLEGTTPEKIWSGTKPDISHLREFGTPVYILQESTKPSKMKLRSNKYIFVGYEDGLKAVRYYDVKSCQVRVSRNYRFLQEQLPKQTPNVQREGEVGSTDMQPPGGADMRTPHKPLKNQNECMVEDDENSSDNKNRDQSERRSSVKRDSPNRKRTHSPEKELPRRTKRKVIRQDYCQLNDPAIEWAYLDHKSGYKEEIELTQNEADIIMTAIAKNGSFDPTKLHMLREAKSSADWHKWEGAIDAELTQLNEMGTWELVDPPEDRKIIGNKWVLVKKTNKEGEVVKYKARLVVKGYSQIPGMDYTNTFSPVVRLETIWSIMSTAAILDWEIQQMDVKGAYLNGILKEEVYMEQPEGYNDGTGRVCRLKKTLYGLKQSGREWNIELDRRLTNIGFRHTTSDPCVYIRRSQNGTEIITIWVDDLLLFANNTSLMDQLKTQLKSILDITDLGEPRKIVGIEITRDRANKTIQISQTKYIKSILRKYGLQKSNAVGMPLDPKIILEKEETDQEGNRNNGYASLIGSLMYLAVAMRPDIAYAIQRLSSFTATPGLAHWTAAKRVLRYLSGTRSLGIKYEGTTANNEVQIEGWSDTDYANDPRDRISISRYVFKLGNGAITWSSKKQNTVLLSSTEAEYTAMAHAVREAIWLRNLFQELNFTQKAPTTLCIWRQYGSVSNC